jgi:hypothetical protein
MLLNYDDCRWQHGMDAIRHKGGRAMRPNLSVLNTGFALGIILLSLAPAASAEPKEEVAAAAMA